MAPDISKSPLTLGELLASLPEGSRILDLGCGGGSFDYRQSPELQIIALDEKVHDKVGQFPPHARFVQALATSIPLGDATVDLLVANFAFEHFPDAAAALREIDRVTRDRGRVWISIPNAGSFEDQLYRNLFSGGGHLQRPNFESFLRQVYDSTGLKLISYLVLPAGFTYLGENEELRHLTWAIVDALKRTVGLDARTRSGYIFILQKFASAGPGFREHRRCCSACGSPDETSLTEASDESPSRPWNCPICGFQNSYPSSLEMVHLDEVARGLRVQWEKYPETKPERLRELVEERSRWAQQLEHELNAVRKQFADLHSEFDQRGRWGLELDREVHNQREYISRLQEELQKLQAQIDSPYLWFKHLLRKLRP